MAGLAVVALTLTGACGDDDGDAQPSPEVTAFTSGDFDGLPRFPRSDELGEKTATEDTVAQSFVARGATPERVVEFYADRLEAMGWASVRETGRIGAGTYRGVWQRGDRQLVVSATAGPTTGEATQAEDPTVQYSISLEPASAPPEQ